MESRIEAIAATELVEEHISNCSLVRGMRA
jgi:hypothetical protein